MRILLLHHEDDPESGTWRGQQWDRVVDLGIAGDESRQRWGEVLGCSIEGLPRFEITDFTRVREILSAGAKTVVDEHGLDWWELISIRFHEEIALSLRLRWLAAGFSVGDQVFVTRPGFHADILRLAFEGKVQCFSSRAQHWTRARRLARALRNFSPSALGEIIGDKYDAGYRLRRHLVHRRESNNRDCVLLPVAQSNAAKTALGYAAALPDQQFLLVSTRPSGCVAAHPPNVAVAPLAAYGSGKQDDLEFQPLSARWERLKSLIDVEELRILRRIGAFRFFPKLLRDGLTVRNAWLRTFEQERVSAVLCTDDTNPYTRIPLLLAKTRGLPAIACHHGALDGNCLVKKSHADTVLAKGRMERDYLLNTCGLPGECVEIGAPATPRRHNRSLTANVVVFFSEPYELDSGRCRYIYRESLPRLAALCARMDYELVVKLHRMEIGRERKALLRECLPAEHFHATKVVEGDLSEDLLHRTRFALTVQSSAAVDCALRGIPVFLCAWLDYSYYGYLQQFIRFGLGARLQSPAEIERIPQFLEDPPPDPRADFWTEISANRLKQLLSASRLAATA